MVNLMEERIQDDSPTWAVPVLANASRYHRTFAKVVNGNVEIWCTPAEWFRDDVLPVAYQAVPKKWIRVFI
jgi:hypothetical protein